MQRLVMLTAAVMMVAGPLSAADSVLDIGTRRQLFVGADVIQSMQGVRQVLHQPHRREVAIKPEHPWEKFGVSYMVAFKDGDRFRAWYRVDANDFNTGRRRAMTAYAESDDGVHWRKPMLGIIEFNGSRQNNLVWAGGPGNLAPFRDDNPHCKPAERYKAVARSADLYTLVSPDGLRWKLSPTKPTFTDRPFDSHNIAFWDEQTRQYVVYTRGIRKDGPLGRGMDSRFRSGVRWVRRSTSKDFVEWTPLKPIQTGDAPREEFYTNATIRYSRAPDFLLMFPSRFASAREPMPGWKHGKGVNDIALLSSRDGIHFDRTFMEAFIRPGLDPGNWHERSLYMERGILQTASTEMSLYCMQNWRLPSVHIRRYTLRPDGFASVHASYKGGTLLTRPVRFSGDELRINYSTSAVGSLRVGLQQADGRPISGLSLDDCPVMYGDQLDAVVPWKGLSNLKDWVGKPVRLRIELADADLYAIRFTGKRPSGE